MTKYHFSCDFDGVFELEGWAEISLTWDADGDLTAVDVEAIEIEPTDEQHKKIQRGFVGIEERTPPSVLWQAIRQHIVDHLQSDRIVPELVDAAEAQGHIPDHVRAA